MSGRIDVSQAFRTKIDWMRHEQSMFKKVVTVVLACTVELMLQGGDDHAADASRNKFN